MYTNNNNKYSIYILVNIEPANLFQIPKNIGVTAKCFKINIIVDDVRCRALTTLPRQCVIHSQLQSCVCVVGCAPQGGGHEPPLPWADTPISLRPTIVLSEYSNIERVYSLPYIDRRGVGSAFPLHYGVPPYGS